MDRYDASTYGERIAEVYDAVYQGYEDAAITLLSDLAHGGGALELGIGTEQGIQLYPVQLRYVWPAELDLMARLAGMRLRSRWGGWQREPFTAASERHVSIYERASGG